MDAHWLFLDFGVFYEMRITKSINKNKLNRGFPMPGSGRKGDGERFLGYYASQELKICTFYNKKGRNYSLWK